MLRVERLTSLGPTGSLQVKARLGVARWPASDNSLASSGRHAPTRWAVLHAGHAGGAAARRPPPGQPATETFGQWGLLPPAALEGCAYLAQLRALVLWWSPLEEAALAALLAATPRIERLVTSASLPVEGQLPAAVRERRWAGLCLMDEDLADLPPGRYLQGKLSPACRVGVGVGEMQLFARRAARLPRCRRRLLLLRRVAEQHRGCLPGALFAALQLLHPPPPTPRRLPRPDLAGPHALAGATCLRLLELEGNPLVLSAADAALLAALPRLADVQLDLGRCSDAASELLLAAKPGLFVTEAPERRCEPASEGEGSEDWDDEDDELW